jgi:hypothetical protein
MCQATTLLTGSSAPELAAGDRTSIPADAAAAEAGCRRLFSRIRLEDSFPDGSAGMAAGDRSEAAGPIVIEAFVPPAIAAPSLGLGGERRGSSLSSPSANPANFGANAASMRPESAVVRAFFAPSARCAHAVASSWDRRLANSPSSWSRKAADFPGSRAGFGGDQGFRFVEKVRNVSAGPRPFAFPASSPFPSLPDLAIGAAVRSGASRSSSPAIPTSVNNA